jgi:adenine-specific DNA-methyltransferase
VAACGWRREEIVPLISAAVVGVWGGAPGCAVGPARSTRRSATRRPDGLDPNSRWPQTLDTSARCGERADRRVSPEVSLPLARLASVTLTPHHPHDSPERRKTRGAFFTPEALCNYMVDWALRDPADAVLEPSCGEAAFLLAAARRLDDLGASGASLSGVELHKASAAEARRVLKPTGHAIDIAVGDFFSMTPEPRFDAVVGNPPYVRYQDFSGDARVKSREAALRAGVSLTNLASSWAAFTVHSALFLRPGGRLALVLPAELLSVNYAAEVRRFLMSRFASVRLVLFTERVFPGVLEEVVLLLAEGSGPTDHCELIQVRDTDELVSQVAPISRWTPMTNSGKWTSAMMAPQAFSLYSQVLASSGMTTLHTWGETTLGAVTGNNKFFSVSPARAAELGLRPDRDLIELSPPGSRHLRTLTFTKVRWSQLGEEGSASYLFYPASSRLSASARSYIAAGEAAGVDEAYKCRVRNPWWRVPLVPPADLLLTYMNADTSRLTTNAAGVHHLNSVHGLYLHDGVRRLGSNSLSIASLNTLTMLGAEIVGRAYGGGMLKIEPKEADLLPMPSPALVTSAAKHLSKLRRDVARCIETGRLLDAVALVDQVLLVDALGLSPEQVTVLRQARAKLCGRRAARSSGRS